MNTARKVLQYNHVLELFPLRLRNELYAKAKYQDFKQGSYIYRRRDEGTFMVGVMNGRLRLSLSSPEDKEILVTMIERGEMVGEMSVIDGLPRATDLIADSDSTLMVIQRDDFIPLLLSSPEAMLGMMRTDCHRRRRYINTIELMALQSAPLKVAGYLLRLARDYGVEKDGGLHIDARLSQIDMARQLACSRESVNKQLAALVEKGLVSLDGDVVILNDIEGLRQVVAFADTRA
ncbi:MAG: Crp/Fnr family transcriptional regulator [Alphaproteobacteria bacterium]|nr:Crp/Fnr family transcriptional regulator [Alphaproteobacteria bacterium]